jgi:hypothetical protein
MSDFEDRLDACGKNVSALLLSSLDAAVPMWMLELKHATGAQRAEIGSRCAEEVAAHGDVLLYGGKGCAAVFNALAKGIAVAAHQPGGVTVFGRHWCVGSQHMGVPHGPGPCAEEVERAPGAGDEPKPMPLPIHDVYLPGDAA